MKRRILITNAKILTMGDDKRIATSMLVEDGKVIGLDPAPSEVGDTQVLDLQGKTVTPGLIDAHTHLEVIAYTWNIAVNVRPPRVKSLDDMVAVLQEKASSLPEGSWILGQGMHYQEKFLAEGRLPDRYDLDRVSRNHPVAVRFSFHINIFNSKALEILGVDENTPDMDGGYLERDENGVPNGRSNDMWHALNAPDWPHEEVVEAIAQAQNNFLQNGITAIAEFTLFSGGVAAMVELAKNDKLKLRVALYPKVPDVCSLEDAVSGKIRDRFTGVDESRLKLGGMKLFIDGGLTSKAAAMHEPYWGTDHLGDLAFEPEEFKEIVRKLDEQGYQIAVHAIGDRAEDVVLDAYEALPDCRAENGAYHRIEHAGNCLWTDERAQRFIDRNIIPVPQPPFIHTTAAGYGVSLGPVRGKGLFPMRKMIFDQGIPVPGNSDAIGIHPLQHVPMFGIWSMATREMNNGERLNDGEEIDVETGLKMYTRYAARSIGREHEIGSLEPGKYADFVVFDEDLLAIDPNELKDLTPRETWINGEQLYVRN